MEEVHHPRLNKFMIQSRDCMIHHHVRLLQNKDRDITFLLINLSVFLLNFYKFISSTKDTKVEEKSSFSLEFQSLQHLKTFA